MVRSSSVRVLLTGGAGKVGRPLVETLLASGHTVQVVGRREDVVVPGATYAPCDICDFELVTEVMRGMDAVIHLAALPAPDKGAPPDVYRTNCIGTFNIYQAAVDLGIRRVVTASSINAVGYFYGLKGFGLSYLPVDEDHPSFHTDAYSLSKFNVEELGSYFWHREGVTGASLRIPGVYDPTEASFSRFEGARKWAADYLRPKFAMTVQEKLDWASGLEVKFQEYRDRRPFEWSKEGGERGRGSEHMDDDETRLFFNKTNLFTNLDARDSARAFELALTGKYDGYHTLFVNDSNNFAGLPAEELARLVYPKAAPDSQRLEGTTSLVSIDRARKLLGWEPEHSLSRFF
jgi:nucleoside-diphosphate-sugar epimerase